jgi:hypothetical protein
VLRDHDTLRSHLAAAKDAANRVRARAPGAISELRAGVRDIDTSFRSHLAFEESLFVPVLPALALERFRAEHHEQRTMLAALANDFGQDAKDPVTLAEDALWLIEALLRDMHLEDEALATGRVGEPIETA